MSSDLNQTFDNFSNNRNRIVISKSDGALVDSGDGGGRNQFIFNESSNIDALEPSNRVIATTTTVGATDLHKHYLTTSQSSYSFPGDNYLQGGDGSGSSSSPSITNLSDSFASLYLPNFAQQISTTIMSGLNWINQINAATLFQNFWTSGFLRRRFSSHSAHHSPQQHQRNSELSMGTNQNDLTYSQYKFARILNGTIKLQTLKPSELIELSSFGLVELDQDVEPGIGHEFQRYENDKATWCDSCGEFLFPPVMNDTTNHHHMNSNNINNHHHHHHQNLSPDKSPEQRRILSLPNRKLASTTTPASVQADHLLRTYFQCIKCKYVCHWKCLNLIRIDCQPPPLATDFSTTTNASSTSLSMKTAEIDSNNNHNNEQHKRDQDDINSHNHHNNDSLFECNNNNDDASIIVSSDIQTCQTSSPSLLSSEYQMTMNISVFNDDDDGNENDGEIKNESGRNILIESTNTTTKNNKETASGTKSQIESYLITPRIILDLRAKILKYNERVRSKGSGLGITLIDEEKGLFRGFLRVHMNLTRPINVIAGKRPPSIYDIINEDQQEQIGQRRTLTSFYMPRDTVKNIHITSDSTSLQVIKAMLKKFKVVDNPQKFALYLRRRFPEGELVKSSDDGEVIIDDNSTIRISDDNQNEMTISKFLKTSGHEHSLKRLHDHERPLILQLEFDSFAYGSVDIVLQENDNADIAWDAFEVPELRNFLKILEREESEHMEHVKAHYREMRRILQTLIDYEESKLESMAATRATNGSSNSSTSSQHTGSSSNILAVTS